MCEILDEAACTCTVVRLFRHLACLVFLVKGAANTFGKVINSVLFEFSRGPNILRECTYEIPLNTNPNTTEYNIPDIFPNRDKIFGTATTTFNDENVFIGRGPAIEKHSIARVGPSNSGSLERGLGIYLIKRLGIYFIKGRFGRRCWRSIYGTLSALYLQGLSTAYLQCRWPVSLSDELVHECSQALRKSKDTHEIPWASWLLGEMVQV